VCYDNFSVAEYSLPSPSLHSISSHAVISGPGHSAAWCLSEVAVDGGTHHTDDGRRVDGGHGGSGGCGVEVEMGGWWWWWRSSSRWCSCFHRRRRLSAEPPPLVRACIGRRECTVCKRASRNCSLHRGMTIQKYHNNNNNIVI